LCRFYRRVGLIAVIGTKGLHNSGGESAMHQTSQILKVLYVIFIREYDSHHAMKYHLSSAASALRFRVRLMCHLPCP
jgi:hypothetical protein